MNFQVDQRGHFARAVAVIGVLVAGIALGQGKARADGTPVYLPALEVGPRQVAPLSVHPGRGVYDAVQHVTLSASTAGAVIRYTTDGSTPRPDHGIPYAGPVPVGRTTVLRAAAFHPRLAASPVASHTYVFPGDVLGQPSKPPGFPGRWGHVDGEPVESDYAMDPEVALHHAPSSARIVDDLRGLPTISLATEVDAWFGPDGIYSNPMERGRAWERPVAVEFIPAGGGDGFQVDAGVRVAGQFSRHPHANRKHSLSLRFRSEYGPGKLHYPLFPDSPADEFDAVRLRAGQADTFEFFPNKAQYVHDEWGRRSHAAMGSAAAPGRFVHLYINGLYWGLYNLVEEVDEDFADQHIGGGLDGYDIIKMDIDAGPQADVGSLDAYQAMVQVEGVATAAGYEALSRLLDVEQYVDYTILQLYAGNRDWPHNNWIAVRPRAPGGKFQFMVWDIEQMTQLWLDHGQEDRTDTAGAAGLHGRLVANPEYRMLFADRVRKHLGPGGALDPAGAEARYRQVAGEADAGIVPESARWGDAQPGFRTYSQNRDAWDAFWLRNGRGHPQTRQDEWVPERDRLLATFFKERTPAVLEQLRRRGLYPDVPAPDVSRRGATLRIGAPEGMVYYTVDGSDPRQAGGAVSPAARAYKGPVVVRGYAVVRARAFADGAWSAAAEAVFGAPQLEFSEVMYHPPEGPELEYLEIHNPEQAPVQVGGARLEGGVRGTLPPRTRIPPAGHIVVAADETALVARYPEVEAAAEFAGRLANEGEAVRLLDRHGGALAGVDYGDDGLWPLAADGLGYSLVRVAPGAGAAHWRPETWRASAAAGGSPGRRDPDVSHRRVVVSEILAASSTPYEDAVELHNSTEHAVDIGGWLLSDDCSSRPSLTKFRIPAGTVLPPGGRTVFYELDLAAGPRGFRLRGSGEEVCLTAADAAGQPTGATYGFDFPAAQENQPVGRVETSAGPQVAALAKPSFGVSDPPDVEAFRLGRGAPNAPPATPRIVLSEVMYQALPGRGDFVELFNAAPEPVALHTTGRADETWRLAGSVDFALPAGMVLPPGGRAVVVGASPATFLAREDVPPGVPVLGPFGGDLPATGGTVRLEAPVPEDDLAYRVEDSALYRPERPWPLAAAGRGPSLERKSPDAFGGEPHSWMALTRGGTPGRARSSPRLVWLPLVVGGRR